MKSSKSFHFKCIQCGKCCSDKNTIVNLTYNDVLRMQWEKNYSLEDFLKYIGFYVFDNIPNENQLTQMVIPPIQTQNGPAFVGLKKKDNGKCIFLNSKNKCSIYSARPSICRTFPFNFHTITDKEKMHKIDIEMNYTEKALEFCPGIDEKYPKISSNYWLTIGKQAVKEILSEHILIKRWNKIIEEGRVSATAENFLRVILNQPDKIKNSILKKSKKTEKKTYQNRLKEKLKDKNIKN